MVYRLGMVSKNQRVALADDMISGSQIGYVMRFLLHKQNFHYVSNGTPGICVYEVFGNLKHMLTPEQAERLACKV